MDNTTLLVILALVVLAGVGIALFARRRRSETLRQRFGPEYSHTVDRLGDQARAEAELEARQKRVAKLDIRPLPEPEEADGVAEGWFPGPVTGADVLDHPAVGADELGDTGVLLVQPGGGLRIRHARNARASHRQDRVTGEGPCVQPRPAPRVHRSTVDGRGPLTPFDAC